MAKVPRLQDVDVDDAELIQELKKFHQDNWSSADINTVNGQPIRAGDAVTLTDAAYATHNVAKGSPVYVHEVNAPARILWSAAFNKDGRKMMFFMSPEMVESIHTSA